MQLTPPAPVPIDGLIGRNPADPTLRAFMEPRPAQSGSGQRLLRNILGFGPVSQNAERHPIGESVQVCKGQFEGPRHDPCHPQFSPSPLHR